MHRTPGQFLRGKTDQVGVAHDGGKMPTEAKTVGQEDIFTAHAEFFVEIAVAQQDITEKSLGRGHVHVAVFVRTPAGIPTPLFDVFFQFLEQFRIVFFHQFVAVRAFEIESIIGVLLEEFEVIEKGLFDTRSDGALQRPVPDGIEVGGRHRKDFFLFLVF